MSTTTIAPITKAARKLKPKRPTVAAMEAILWEACEAELTRPDGTIADINDVIEALIQKHAPGLGFERSSLVPLQPRKTGRNIGGYLIPYGCISDIPGLAHRNNGNHHRTRAFRDAGLMGHELPTKHWKTGAGFLTLASAAEAYTNMWVTYRDELAEWEANR